jgi:hypothetical protein
VRCVGIGPLCVDRARYFQLTTAPVGRRCDCARPAYPWEMTCAAGGNPYARRRARRGDHRLRTAAAGCRTPLNPRSRRRPSSRQVDELLDERLSALRPAGIRCVSTTKRVVLALCPPRCLLKLSVSESQLSRADYPRPTGRKVP